MQLESRRGTVTSINLLSNSVSSLKSSESRQMRAKLSEMNQRWEMVLARAGEVHRDLQVSGRMEKKEGTKEIEENSRRK